MITLFIVDLPELRRGISLDQPRWLRSVPHQNTMRYTARPQFTLDNDGPDLVGVSGDGVQDRGLGSP